MSIEFTFKISSGFLKTLTIGAVFFIITVNVLVTVDAHTPMNGSEVFVTYAGHSEAGSLPNTQNKPEIRSLVDTGEAKVVDRDPDEKGTAAADEVIFVPNEKPVVRNEDLHYEEVKSFLPDKQSTDMVPVETEPPKTDVLFISGKNYGSKENPDYKKEEKRKKDKKKIVENEEVKDLSTTKLSCSQLDCEVVQEPVCGTKLEQKKWKYRLFLNECFLRKVNCGFKNKINRYKQVPIERCKDAATVLTEMPFVFKATAMKATTTLPVVKIDTRRSIPSRRARNMAANGDFCSHPCPTSCTEEYDPQCATSASGQIRVFVNHCKLDENSCMYRVVWHQRPLSWCVGGKKADVQQNRGFIGWMQRNGLVDKKGRLTLH